MNGDLIRIIDSIHRDKEIDPEVLFAALEEALLSAARKHYGDRETLRVVIDRRSGQARVLDGDVELDAGTLGRIDAQTAKQVMIQKLREAERDVLFREFEGKVHEIANGTVQRSEGSTLIVNLGKSEAIVPRREQIPDETFRPGDRIRAYVIEVKKVGSRVRVVLSRTHPDLVRRLFELEVPEILEHIIEIKALAREPGHRTKIAVSSSEAKVDPIGACVGVRGTRIKNIVNELGGEKVDIVPWSDNTTTLIANALRPAEISAVTLSPETGKARVVVVEDQLSLAIGKRGQNVRLAARLTGWDIDVMTAAEVREEEFETLSVLVEIPGMTEELARRLYGNGLGLRMLSTCHPEELGSVPGMSPELALAVITRCGEVLQQKQAEAAAAAQQEASAAAQPEGSPAAAEGEAPVPSTAPAGSGESTGESSETIAESASEPSTQEGDKPPAEAPPQERQEDSPGPVAP